MKKTLQKMLALIMVLGLMLGMASIAEAKTATRLTMSRRTLTMDWGTRYTLSVSVTPSNASDRGAITWVSDNPLVEVTPGASTRNAVVRVDPIGEYPTVPVTITASTPSGVSATCKITLKQITVKSISVSPSSKTVYFSPSQPPVQLNAVYYFSGSPASSDQLGCTWTTNNGDVVTVDGNGLVNFTGEGTARITATYAPGISDYCVFTVKPVRVKSIALDKSIHYLDPGEDFTLNATVNSAMSAYPKPSYGNVDWRSSDDNFATVDQDGVVTAHNSGIATITATTDTGRYVKSASCTVYVRDDDPTTLTITAGGDCVLGGDPRTTGITARSTQREYEKLIVGNPAYPFERIAALFNDRGGYTNLSIVNVEVCLTTKGGSNPSTDRKFIFRGNPKNAAALNAGIDIANIANNHTSDFGTASFGNTANSIKSNSAAEPSGYNRYNGALYLPVITTPDGKKIGFYGVQANQVPASVMTSRIKKYRNDYDLDMMVVTIHWTGQKEYVRPVTSTMKSYARGAINAGADLVIGHHRHEISGIEKYKGKYILYDLGNFATGGVGGQATYAVQIDFKISSSFAETASMSKDGPDQIRIYPLCTTSGAMTVWNGKKYAKQPNNWQPAPAEKAIHHKDRVTGEDVLDTTISDQVVSIINSYSPTGPDGSKFNAAPYITPYSTLTD